MRRARQFALSPGDGLLLMEALVWLCWAKALLLLVPFRWIAPHLGREMAESAATIPSSHEKQALRVSWAVLALARRMPSLFVCLPQAMAAKWMLRRRGLPSTLYLGVRVERKAEFKAHAWLRAGQKILTGRKGSANHKVIATFSEEAKT